MENATTALYIAAGTLIGVMIISLVVFFFRRVGTMYSEQDAIMSTEQLSEWNKEYLAYDKKLMYGTDLVSVLNKATNNNLKYVNGEGFLSGFTYTNAYNLPDDTTFENYQSSEYWSRWTQVRVQSVWSLPLIVLEISLSKHNTFHCGGLCSLHLYAL